MGITFCSSTSRAGFLVIAALMLVGCETTAPTASSNQENAVPITRASTISPLPNGVLRTEQGYTLTVRNGEPVAYTTTTPYTARDVRRLPNGEIIIDQARIINVEPSEDQISGLFTLGFQRTPVVFKRIAP